MNDSSDLMRMFIEKTVARPDVERLFASRSSAESYLTHDDPKVRWAALAVLEHHWDLDGAVGSLCERILFDDPHPDVQAAAVSCLSQCYYETNDTRIGRLIAEIVCDTSKTEVLRCAAYRSLFKLRRSAHLTVASRHLFTAKGFRFPEDVDWRFVDTFLFGGQRNSPIDPNDLLFL